jgi:hypothetical protein
VNDTVRQQADLGEMIRSVAAQIANGLVSTSRASTSHSPSSRRKLAH